MASDMDVDWVAEESQDPPDGSEDDEEATADEEGWSPVGTSSSRQGKRGRGGSKRGTVMSLGGYPRDKCNCGPKHVATVQQTNATMKAYLLEVRQGESIPELIKQFKGERYCHAAVHADQTLVHTC